MVISVDGTSVNGVPLKDEKYAFRSGRGKGDDSFATGSKKYSSFSWTGMEGLKLQVHLTTMNDAPRC